MCAGFSQAQLSPPLQRALGAQIDGRPSFVHRLTGGPTGFDLSELRPTYTAETLEPDEERLARIQSIALAQSQLLNKTGHAAWNGPIAHLSSIRSDLISPAQRANGPIVRSPLHLDFKLSQYYDFLATTDQMNRDIHQNGPESAARLQLIPNPLDCLSGAPAGLTASLTLLVFIVGCDGRTFFSRRSSRVAVENGFYSSSIDENLALPEDLVGRRDSSSSSPESRDDLPKSPTPFDLTLTLRRGFKEEIGLVPTFDGDLDPRECGASIHPSATTRFDRANAEVRPIGFYCDVLHASYSVAVAVCFAEMTALDLIAFALTAEDSWEHDLYRPVSLERAALRSFALDNQMTDTVRLAAFDTSQLLLR